MLRRTGLVIGLVTILAATAGVAGPGGARSPDPANTHGHSDADSQLLPDGFSDTMEHAFADTDYPTALAWLPDGRMLATTKEGRLWLFPETEQGYGQPTVVLDLSSQICADTERGLVGLAVDPEYVTNGFVYLYWTHDVHGVCDSERLADAPQNRVTRHRLDADGSEVARQVIVDHIVSPRPHHIAGDLEFDRNGFLYISVGDGVCRIPEATVCGGLDNNSQLRRLPHGKILRVTRYGWPVPDNPYVGIKGARRCTRPSGVPPGTGPCKEIFALGLRNPFRIVRRPGTDNFFVNDVGQHHWEEIDRLKKGANYGWNAREGHCARDSTTNCGPTRFVNPIHDYPHGDCRSVTGGAFVPVGLWPDWFDGAYLFADFTCDKIFRLVQDGTGARHVRFLAGIRQPVDLRFGPSPLGRSLYYISFFKREIHRVTYSQHNIAPVAGFSSLPNGMAVAFNGGRSYDPDQDGIATWRWNFGDGHSRTTATASTNHTYGQPGSYNVTLTVTDAEGATSRPFTKRVTVPEHRPSLNVDWPPGTRTFAVGARVSLTASATDPEDGTLPGSAIRWEFRLRHGNHFHPIAVSHGNQASVTYPPPEDLEAAGDSSVVAIVTATDSNGLTSTDQHTLAPSRVRLTFRTSPDGGVIRIDGGLRRATFSAMPWVGQTFRVRAPDQRIDGRRYVFGSWSDGKPREHNITAPRASSTFTARFHRPG